MVSATLRVALTCVPAQPGRYTRTYADGSKHPHSCSCHIAPGGAYTDKSRKRLWLSRHHVGCICAA
eukprot:1021454-Amphidinium_carterae.1